MAAQRYGGKYSPDQVPRDAKDRAAPQLPPFQNRRARQVSLRARLMYFLPLPLLFAAIGSIGRGSASEMIGEIGAFAGLMVAAWLLNEGLRAEEAYDARTVARPPAVPRKSFSAGLVGASIALAFVLSLGQPLFAALAFGGVAAAAHLLSFGMDPLKKKGMEGVDEFTTQRVARAIDDAEKLLSETHAAAERIGDRRLEGRIDRLGDQARAVFRAIEEDPRDLPAARSFLSVYLLGLRDSTVKFADLWNRSRDAEARTQYEALLEDLEQSFASKRTMLLEDNRSDLDVEIEVLRERLQQDGLTVR